MRRLGHEVRLKLRFVKRIGRCSIRTVMRLEHLPSGQGAFFRIKHSKK